MEAPCIADHHVKKEDFEVVGEVALIAHRSLLHACIQQELVELTCGGQVTRSQEQSQEWIRACDQTLARLISCIHFTKDH